MAGDALAELVSDIFDADFGGGRCGTLLPPIGRCKAFKNRIGGHPRPP